MQHNHTNATHGHIDVGDVISDVFCLKFKWHRRLFNDGHGMCTACRRRSHGPPHQRTDLPPGAPQAILSTSRGMLEVGITLVRPTQHPSWQFVTTRLQSLHKRARRANELGGNGSSCGLITRQNAPLAPVSIARHHDTSAQPPEAPPDPPCRPDGAEGFRLTSSPNTASSNCGLAGQGKKTNLDWLRLMDSTQRPNRAPVCVTARAGS